MLRDQNKLLLQKIWFKGALMGILCFSLLLRFWSLGKFNSLVFDEVYYPVFANNYLLGNEVYNAHPPLSQYLIAMGIWLGSHLPFGQDIANSYLGSWRTTFSYRWLNALIGAFLPLVIAGIAYQLTSRRSYALVAAFLAACDGLFLVESRFALNNIYLVLFGLLGQLFFLLALKTRKQKRWLNLAFSGIFLGLSASIKWNGLGFLLGICLLWLTAWTIRYFQVKKRRLYPLKYYSHNYLNSKTFSTPLQKLTQINFLTFAGYLLIIPALTYRLSWVPHLIMNPEPNFWEMQKEIMSFHQKVGSGPDIHPYCSRWYTWILMLRPVAYFYQTARNQIETVPTHPPLPSGTGKIIYDVHAMGNPLLWWLSSAAIILLIIALILRFFKEGIGRYTSTPQTWLALYLAFNYGANLLPWVKVSRCTFIYHYMAASVFAQLVLAWLVDRWLSSRLYGPRYAGIAVIFLVLIAFSFWLPIYLGLPLSPESYKLRMWFNWI